MIKLYSGTPGSGKSLHLASRIYYTLRAGRPVVGNFEIDLKSINKKHPEKLNFTYLPNMAIKDAPYLCPEELMKFSRNYFNGRRPKEDHIFLVIDECQIIFNSRAWQATGRSDWLTFFSQHRKFGYEIVLVAQFDGMIDKQIRSLIEYDFKHRKLSNFGMAGRIMALFTANRAFCAVQYWYPINERVGAEWFLAKNKYYRIYDTYKNFDDPTKQNNI